MSEFEIWQLVEANQENITDQFQFWMATTFAVVIASYTAGSRLTIWARSAIALLYTIAVAVFYIRYMNHYDLLGQLAELLQDSTLDQPSGVLPSVLRRIVMMGGSILALILIFAPTVVDHDKDDGG